MCRGKPGSQPGPGAFGEEKSLDAAGGLWEPDVGTAGLGGREGSMSSRVTLESLDFFPKARKRHGQGLEATLVARGGGLEGLAWRQGGTLDGT